MNTSVTPLPQPSHWPVDVTHYDRSPDLNEAERAELERLMSRKPFQLRPSSKLLLHRLLLPLEDGFAVTHLHPHICGETRRVMLMEMYHRGKTFWAWSDAEWREIIGSSNATFAQRYGRTYGARQQHPARRELVVLAYLLCSPITIDPLLGPFAIAPIARKVWGAEILDTQVKLLTAVLRKWGYQEKHPVEFIACTGYLLLRNRSPHLETLDYELLEAINQTCTIPCVHDYLFQISRALWALGLIRQPLPDPKRASRPRTSETDGQIAESWLAWCQRWQAYSPAQEAGHTYYLLRKRGSLAACTASRGQQSRRLYLRDRDQLCGSRDGHERW